MSPADTPEPPPRVGTGDVWLEAISDCQRWTPLAFDLREDMFIRRDFGIRKHGTPLQRDNERRHWVDCYQEALDLIAYAWAARGPWWLRWGAVAFAWAIRRHLPRETP